MSNGQDALSGSATCMGQQETLRGSMRWARPDCVLNSLYLGMFYSICLTSWRETVPPRISQISEKQKVWQEQAFPVQTLLFPSHFFSLTLNISFAINQPRNKSQPVRAPCLLVIFKPGNKYQLLACFDSTTSKLSRELWTMWSYIFCVPILATS